MTTSKGDGSRTIRIDGLDGLKAEFQKLPAVLQDAVNELTPQIAQYVGQVTQANASTKAEKKVAGSAIVIKGSSVVLGGPGSDAGRMALGTEHGGRARKTTQQFRAFRGQQGYFFWPAIRKHSDVIKKKWDALLDHVIEELVSG